MLPIRCCRPLLQLAGFMLLGLLAAGCVTQMGGAKPSTELSHVNEATAGFLLLSIGGPTDSSFITWGLQVQRLDGPGDVDITYDGRGLSLGTPRDYHEDDLAGAVFHVPLPPGQYAITGYTFFLQGMAPGSYGTYQPAAPLAIPFTIRQGQTTYLGEFVGMPARRALFGWSSIHGAYWWLRDQQTRDVAIARQKWPARPLDTIMGAIPSPADAPAPSFSRSRKEDK